MKTLKKFLVCPMEAVVLAALLALMSLSMFAAPGTSGKEVLVSGWLIMDAGNAHDVLVVVELDGELCMPVKLRSNGKFSVALPAGSQAVMRFSKPGHLTKEVVVDTRNAAGHQAQDYKATKVHFGVELSAEEGNSHCGHAGPVGTVAFKRGTGAIAVKHHKRSLPTGAPCADHR